VRDKVEAAISEIRSADQATQAKLKAGQDEYDRRRKIFLDAMGSAKPDPDELHRTLAMNLTTRPTIRFEQLALTWMQAHPGSWHSWHPEQCEEVAAMIGVGEQV
jgi:hypothetical protein